MDNKQDRLFYWEVKDFLTKTKNPDINSVKRASSLKEDITKVMSLNSPFYVDKDLVQPRISNDIRNSVLPLIALNESSIQKATPRNVGSSPNITSNLFNLTEAPAQSFGSLGGGASSSGSTRRRPEDERPAWRDRDPRNEEKYQENLKKQTELKTKREDKVKELDSYKQQGPTDPSERGRMQATRIADVISRTSAQDPSTLSAKDAGELALAKIMMRGGDLSKPNAELETTVRSKVAGMQGKSDAAIMQGPTESGGNLGDQAQAQSDTARSRTKAYFDADTESTFNVSRDATQRDVTQREQQNRADAAQQAAARKEKMQNVKIQGTNMTYGEFKSNTGRDYDATNREDSSLVSRQAGAGRYSSAEARDLAGSTDSMINMQRSANDARVAEGGRLTRQMDRSAQALSDFQNNPEIRAREIAKDKASVMPQVMAQINAETSKRDRLEAEGRALAVGDKAKIAADKETALKASLEKNSIRIPSKTYVEPGAMGPPKPTIPFMLGGTEQRPDKQPFLPTPTGSDNANLAAGRADVRAREQAKAQRAAELTARGPELIARGGININDDPQKPYQKDLDMARKPSNELIGRYTGYPVGDESLVTRPSDEFSDANVVGEYGDPNNTAPNLIKSTVTDKANIIRTQTLAKAKADRLQRIKDQTKSSLPATPDLISKPNPGLPGDAMYGTKSEYGTSLLSDIMQSGTSTTPGTSTTSRPAVAPGSPKDIEDQLKRLRGQ